MLQAPGNTIAMLHNSPKILCHLFWNSRFWEGGILARISLRRFCRWGGRVIVMVVEFMIHSKTVLIVFYDKLLWHNFFIDTGSWWCTLS